MTTQADFTAKEWNILLQAPAFAALYLIQADIYSQAVAYQKMMAGIKAIMETAQPTVPSALVSSVRQALVTGQRPIYAATFPRDLREGRQIALEGCCQAAALLAQRAPADEAEAYSSWLLAISAIVAATPCRTPRGPSAGRGTELTRAAIETLSAALQRSEVYA